MPPDINSAHGTTSAGITTDTTTGERHIPSSTRADGSTRREIRIRPGYRPPEDVERYKNPTAEAWKTRGGGVPGAEGLRESSKAASVNSVKNAKRREARKRAKAVEADIGSKEIERDNPSGPRMDGSGHETLMSDQVASMVTTENVQDLHDEEAQRMKQVRKLRKKLREARELEEKREKGEGLLHEQFEKVIKISQLVRDLDNLGFDAKGDLIDQREVANDSAQRR